MTVVRVNLFQRLVQRWEKLHPYNGAQVLRVAAPLPSPAAIETHWKQTLECLGLGALDPAAPPGHYSLSAPLPPGQSVPVQIEPDQLDSHLSAELNRRFADADAPLRPFFAPISPNEFWMGISYRHWLADSVAIRRVLGEWFGRMVLGQSNPTRPPYYAPADPSPADASHADASHADSGSAAESSPAVFSPAGYRQLFAPRILGGPMSWSPLNSLLESARQSSRMKRVRRVEGPDARDRQVAFSLHRLPDGVIERVRTYARSRDCKVNDVLLTALGLAVARHGPLVRTAFRQDVALGTIVDLRPLAPRDLSRTFGLFLGFTTVFLRPRHLRSFNDALATIARQHARARANQSAPASMIRMLAGLAAHRLLRDPRKVLDFYRKRVPLSAGISNVNLGNHPLAGHHPGTIREFVRVSPTGPLMPIVISATTLGQTFHFGLTRVTSAISTEMANAIANDISRQLSEL